jgi:hypothetical protein
MISFLWWWLTIPAIRRFHDARHLLEEYTVRTLDLGVLIYSDLFLRDPYPPRFEASFG